MRIAILMTLSTTWCRETALQLARQGHSVHAIDFEREVNGNYLRERDDLHAPAVRKLRAEIDGVHQIPGKHISPLRYLMYAPRLRKIYENIGADVLLTLWGGGFAQIAHLSGIRPYCVYVGGGDILRVAGLAKRLSARALSQAAVVFANGEYFGERAREFAPRANVCSLYYGVDPDRFTPGKPPATPIQIVCTRGFNRPYNNAYLIQALQVMPENVPDFRVVFTSAGELLEETKALADSILSPSQRRRVEFLNGVTDDRLLQALQESHLYTSASRYDGTSISLLEAMSCGLFPVISDIPANREWIEPSVENGVLFPLDQPQAYAAALTRGILEAQTRSRASAWNRQLISDRADARKTASVLAATLETVIASRN